MGVSLPGAGGGRGRGQPADLNLVPFIDLLSVCITFLLLTAVWVQISSLPIDQEVSDGPPTIVDPEVPPLVVHVRSDGVWSGRDKAGGRDFRGGDAPHDWVALQAFLEGDRALYPEERQAIILTDDGVAYEHMIQALDLTRSLGYERSLLGGGEAEKDGGISSGG